MSLSQVVGAMFLLPAVGLVVFAAKYILTHLNDAAVRSMLLTYAILTATFLGVLLLIGEIKL